MEERGYVCVWFLLHQSDHLGRKWLYHSQKKKKKKNGFREREREIGADLRDIHREGGDGGCEAELLEFAHGGRGFRERVRVSFYV